jgi:stage V sporulation protein G
MPDIEVTEVRVKIADDGDDKLLGYCTLTVNNALVIKDLKIIRGESALFVAMPSRRITDRCPRCRQRNHLRARFCNECGHRLPSERGEKDARGRPKLHFDLIHPIRPEIREMIQRAVVAAYQQEVSRAHSARAAMQE